MELKKNIKTARNIFILLTILGFSSCSKKLNPNFYFSGQKKPIITQDYSKLLQEINNKKNSYTNCASIDSTIKSNIRDYLVSTAANKLMPQWYGTDWDYNGVTKKPQKSSIACGYFVSTILKDLGFNLSRKEMSTVVSSRAIASLCNKKDRKWLNVGKNSVKDLENYVKKHGKGLYLLGLDKHFGIILNSEKGVYFIHSSYIPFQDCVIKEELKYSLAIKLSNSKVVGKLFSDRMIDNWIDNTYIPVKKKWN